MKRNKILKIHPNDNVIVALIDLLKDTLITTENLSFKLVSDVKEKHKFSIQDLSIGDQIYMYGVVVGKAKKTIKQGEIINTQNIIHETQDYSISTRINRTHWVTPDLDSFSNQTFLGYKRKDEQYGTENNWLVIPLVFCQNRNVEVLKESLLKGLGYESNDNNLFNIDELISKFKSGVSEKKQLQG